VTRTQLESLRAANALPHTLRYDQLEPYHVPFDELCGGSAVEGELAHWLAHRGRVALIGPSGSGKSSALAWVLAHRRPENLAVLRIPIAGTAVSRVRGRRILSKCGQYLDVVFVAYGEDARVERDQAHPAATSKCQ
jgi:hypothetical protein